MTSCESWPNCSSSLRFSKTNLLPLIAFADDIASLKAVLLDRAHAVRSFIDGLTLPSGRQLASHFVIGHVRDFSRELFHGIRVQPQRSGKQRPEHVAGQIGDADLLPDRPGIKRDHEIRFDPALQSHDIEGAHAHRYERLMPGACGYVDASQPVPYAHEVLFDLLEPFIGWQRFEAQHEINGV